MSTSVRSRVHRLERGPIGAAARCRFCGGLGRPAFRVEYDPDIPPIPEDRVNWPAPPQPEGCPASHDDPRRVRLRDHCVACGRRIVFRLLPPRRIEDTPAAALQP
jgi:hypothetical protein